MTGAIRGFSKEKIYSYTSRTGNIPLVKTKHNFFKNPSSPSAIIEWNNLDPPL